MLRPDRKGSSDDLLVSEHFETLLDGFIVVDIGNVDVFGGLLDSLKSLVQAFAESFDCFWVLVTDVGRFVGIVSEVVDVLVVGFPVVEALSRSAPP